MSIVDFFVKKAALILYVSGKGLPLVKSLSVWDESRIKVG